MSIADYVRENTGVPTGTETIAPVLAGELPAETITRSNGESYIPGRIEGMSDVEFLQRCRKAGLFLRVKSAPGTGKSAMFDAAFGEEGLFVLCSEGTTEEDLFGGYHPTDTPGKFIWKDGPVTTALREGRPLLLDELNAASPRTATKMNSLFDGRLEILLGNGELVRATPGFWAMIAYNPGVIGFELAQAMRSRFCLAATVKTNLTSAAALGVADKAIKVAGQLGRWYEAQEFAAAGGVTEGTEFETSPWAPQMRELLAFKRIADEFGEIVAARNLLGVAEEEDAGGQMAAALEAHFGAGVAATGLQIA